MVALSPINQLRQRRPDLTELSFSFVVHLWVPYLVGYLSTYLPIYLSTYLPIYLSTYLPSWLPIYLVGYLSTCLPSYLPNLDLVVALSPINQLRQRTPDLTELSFSLVVHLWVTYLVGYLSTYLPIYLSMTLRQRILDGRMGRTELAYQSLVADLQNAEGYLRLNCRALLYLGKSSLINFRKMFIDWKVDFSLFSAEYVPSYVKLQYT